MECMVPLAAPDAYALVTDVGVHERWVPLTTITAPGRALRPGDEVVAVTAGAIVDRMHVIDAVSPSPDEPGRMRFHKTGPLLLGDVEITVTPTGPAHATVRWHADLHLAGPLPAVLTRPVVTVGYAGMLALIRRALVRDATALARVRDARSAPHPPPTT